jgi:AcrR family transcriptional regulator
LVRADGVRAKKAAATRNLIITIARKLFSSQGYNASPIEQIVEEAQITRGALYHHFQDKRDLFRAVFHAVELELAARANPVPAEISVHSWRRFRHRIQTFLDAILRPEFHRILLIDGPAVLGWADWRALESEYGLGAISKALDIAMREGHVRKQAISPLAHIILAAIDEAALLIANSEERGRARREVGAALDAFLNGLTITK